jgi:hypothetical protein
MKTSVWLSVDPLVEKTMSAYGYCYGNPIKLVDPTGKEPNDVIIKGGASGKAFTELQKSVSSEMNLSMSDSGKLSYTQKDVNAKLSDNAQLLANAINDHSIVVNANASLSNKTDAGIHYIGGAFTGAAIGFDENYKPTMHTYQQINPYAMSLADEFLKKPGENTLHEITESYNIGKFLSLTKTSFVGFATAKDGADPFSAYNMGHNSASPQVPAEGYEAEYRNKDGESSDKLMKGGSASYFVTSPNGKEIQRFESYP